MRTGAGRAVGGTTGGGLGGQRDARGRGGPRRRRPRRRRSRGRRARPSRSGPARRTRGCRRAGRRSTPARRRGGARSSRPSSDSTASSGASSAEQVDEQVVGLAVAVVARRGRRATPSADRSARSSTQQLAGLGGQLAPPASWSSAADAAGARHVRLLTSSVGIYPDRSHVGDDLRAVAPARPRGRGHPHHPRGGGRVRAAGAAVLRRQGLDRDAPPGREGVLAGPGAVPGDARRHRPQLPRGPRVPRPHGRPSSASASSSPACRTTSTPGRVVEDTGPRASRNRLQTVTLLDGIEEHALRRRLRRRPARRGEGPGQGAGVQLPRRVRPVGPEEPAARAVEPLQRPAPQGRAHPGVPALELDRARHLAVHRRRGASSSRRSTSPTTAQVFQRDGMLDGRLAADPAPADGEEVEERTGALPHRRRRHCTGAVESPRRHARAGHRRGRRHPPHRAGRHPGRRPHQRGRHGRPQEARGTSDGELLRLRHRRLGRRRQVHPHRPPALRLEGDLRGPARGGRAHRRASGATSTPTWRCSPTACGPSASRASRSTSPTATSPRPSGSSSSPTPPGHIQYTRNMVTGASTADLALILVDARKGIARAVAAATPSCRRCSASRTSSLCVNKMDLVDWTEERFEEIKAEFRAFAMKLDVARPHVRARLGAARRQRRRPLGTTCPGTRARRCCTTSRRCTSRRDRNLIDARFPVQYVIRPQQQTDHDLHDYRGYAGRSPAACSSRATRWSCCRRASPSTIASIDTADGPVDEAFAPDVGHGPPRRRDRRQPRRHDLPAATTSPTSGQDIDAMVCWMTESHLAARRAPSSAIKHTTRSARALVKDLQYRLDVNTLHRDEDAVGPVAQRDRPGHAAHHAAAVLRRVPPQPHHRQLHPRRRGHQHHRRRRA